MKHIILKQFFLQHNLWTWPLELPYNIFKGIIMSIIVVTISIFLLCCILSIFVISKIHKLIMNSIEEEFQRDYFYRRHLNEFMVNEAETMLRTNATFMSQKKNYSLTSKINWQSEGF